MRATALLFLLYAELVFSASILQSHKGSIRKRQSGFSGSPGDLNDFLAGLLGSMQGAGGKVADPAGAAPRKVVLQSPSKIPGAKRVKIRSGPYNVGNMSKKSPSRHAGMLENYPDFAIEKPCADECTILTQEAGLEYPDGSNANIDTGMWLHHMVHFNSGPSRWDATGLGRTCIPFLPLGSSPSKAERYFTSGNERTPFHFNEGGTDLSAGSGYHITKSDKFLYLVELMNMNMEDKVVYLTMTYDYIEGPLPKGWTNIKTIWLDANQCGTSEIKPPKENGTFTIESKPWKPNFEGKIVSAMGHLHDGGVEFEFRPSADASLCKVTAKYAEKPEYTYRGTSMGGDKVAKSHISSMSGCQKDADFSIKELKKDQSWVVRGQYDYSTREGNLERGKQADIMTLGIVFISVPPGGVQPPGS